MNIYSTECRSCYPITGGTGWCIGCEKNVLRIAPQLGAPAQQGERSAPVYQFGTSRVDRAPSVHTPAHSSGIIIVK